VQFDVRAGLILHSEKKEKKLEKLKTSWKAIRKKAATHL